MPAGTIFDFQKDGKLLVTVVIKGEKKMVEFGYELKGKVLRFDIPGGKLDVCREHHIDQFGLRIRRKGAFLQVGPALRHRQRRNGDPLLAPQLLRAPPGVGARRIGCRFGGGELGLRMPQLHVGSRVV